MSQINIRNLSNENDDGSPEIVGVSTFSATSYFVPPKGTTLERPSDCEPGSIRFNTDIGNLEYFRGKTLGWSQFELVTPNLGGRLEDAYSTTSSNDGGLGTRLLLAGGRISAPAFTDMIEYLTISTTGNTDDFGNLVSSHGNPNSQNGAASRTRGIWLSGQLGSSPNYSNVVQEINFASQGDAQDFGDAADKQNGRAASGDSSIRGVFMGGRYSPSPSQTSDIQLITIASRGNSVKFGDLATEKKFPTGTSSKTRALCIGGATPTALTDIEYVTIATEGNAVDFGDLLAARYSGAAASNDHGGL